MISRPCTQYTRDRTSVYTEMLCLFFLGTQEIGGGGVGRCGGSGRKDLGSREALLPDKSLCVQKVLAHLKEKPVRLTNY